MNKKIKSFVLLFFLLITLLLSAVYLVVQSPNFVVEPQADKIVYVDKNTTFADIYSNLKKEQVFRRQFTFVVCQKLLFGSAKPRVGAYSIESSTSNYDLLNKIKNGVQTPVKLKINTLRLKTQLASKISRQTNIDSLELIDFLNNNDSLKGYNLNKETALTLFLPNTYEVYWSITIRQLFARMQKEYNRFWSEQRMQKANKISLSPVEVIVLASIVEEETNKADEKPIVAGLYINRLKKNMRLQADPTVRFALGNFGINQVLSSYLTIESPYNTYLNIGLPPGPIRIPSLEGIDAVLNRSNHNYLYMCAKPEMNGYHNFSETYSGHQKNAKLYYVALREWKKKRAER